MTRTVSTVTRKGQVTIPIEIRRQLDIREGDRIEFVQTDGRIGIVPIRPDRTSVEPPEIVGLPSDSLVRRVYEVGVGYRRDRPLSIEEMKAAAARGWTERERRHQEHRQSDVRGGAE
jgi:AbrB family looped-hinge helix DNA binding protein